MITLAAARWLPVETSPTSAVDPEKIRRRRSRPAHESIILSTPRTDPWGGDRRGRAKKERCAEVARRRGRAPMRRRDLPRCVTTTAGAWSRGAFDETVDWCWTGFGQGTYGIHRAALGTSTGPRRILRRGMAKAPASSPSSLPAEHGAGTPGLRGRWITTVEYLSHNTNVRRRKRRGDIPGHVRNSAAASPRADHARRGTRK